MEDAIAVILCSFSRYRWTEGAGGQLPPPPSCWQIYSNQGEQIIPVLLIPEKNLKTY
jgi:hypothetical protein